MLLSMHDQVRVGLDGVGLVTCFVLVYTCKYVQLLELKEGGESETNALLPVKEVRYLVKNDYCMEARVE